MRTPHDPHPPPGVTAIVAHAHGVRNATRRRIEDAMRAIELDIEKHGGIYPHSTRVTQAEVCRRAGISRMTLQKDQHRQTRDDLKAWLAELERKMAIGAKVVRRAVTDRIDEYKAAYNEIAQHWHEAELAHLETADRLAAAEVEIQALRARVSELQDQLTAALKAAGAQKVVPIPRGARGPKIDPA